MTNKKLRSVRRRGALVLSATMGLLSTGCTDAVIDAVAAGALSFIQTGVMNTLSSTVFGDGAMSGASSTMDEVMMSSDGEHDVHDG